MNDKHLFWVPFDVLEKASDSDNPKSRVIGGYASTEALDKHGEILIQKGLDFSDFLKSGWLNDNHSRDTSGVVGYPLSADFHEGKGWYITGYILKGYKLADDIWELAKSLAKSGERRLGFSVEGNDAKRQGNKVIKAVIKNVAVTHCPVNPECTLEILAKSLCPHSETTECNQHEDCCMKALEAGYSESIDAEGGSALRKQSLDGKVTDTGYGGCTGKCEGKCEGKCKGVNKSDIDNEKIITQIKSRGYNDLQSALIYSKFVDLGLLQINNSEE